MVDSRLLILCFVPIKCPSDITLLFYQHCHVRMMTISVTSVYNTFNSTNTALSDCPLTQCWQTHYRTLSMFQFSFFPDAWETTRQLFTDSSSTSNSLFLVAWVDLEELGLCHIPSFTLVASPFSSLGSVKAFIEHSHFICWRVKLHRILNSTPVSPDLVTLLILLADK
jgi:hypothetical protein